MTTVGVAAVAAPEMVSRSEDEVRAFVVEILRAEFFAEGLQVFFVDILRLRHGVSVLKLHLLPFTPFV
jgi:hypothetical protein